MGDVTARVLDAVYAVIDDDTAFADLPKFLSGAIGASWASLYALNNQGGVVEASHGFAAPTIETYAAYFAAIDPLRAGFTRLEPNVATRFDRIVPYDILAQSEYYYDFARPHGDIYHGVGVLIDDGDERRILSVQRARRDPAFTDDHEAVLRTLQPHLARAFRARRGLARADRTAQLTDGLFEEQSDAILLCDATQRVLHRNRAARALPLSCVTIGRNGRLTFTAARAQDMFLRAIEDVLRQRVSTSFHIPRAGKLPYRVDVDGATTNTATAVVTILDFERLLTERIARAQRLYAFTPSECALAESLLRGRTAQEHAALRGTAVSTARAQLHLMLAKTETHRQAEMIAVLTR